MTATTIGSRFGKRKRNPIPLDLTIEILLRLPARSIARFRLACKLWRSTTLDPHFIDAHLDLTRKRRPLSILLFGEGNDVTILGGGECDSWTPKQQFCPRPKREDDIIFHGSCNGILCISSNNDQIIQLLNPATGDSFTLPTNRNFQRLHLGFHPVSKEYKVLSLCPKQNLPHMPECRVYTVGTDNGSWREINAIPDIDLFDGVYDDAPVVNGVMYLISDVLRDSQSVVAFDLKDESFKQFPFPDVEIEESDAIRIVELQGSVCVSFRSFEQMDIWRLNVDKFGDTSEHEWTLMYSILPWNVMDPMSPLCIHKDKILTREHFSKDDTSRNTQNTGFYGANMLCYRDIKGNLRGDKILYMHEIEYWAYVHVETLVALPNQ